MAFRSNTPTTVALPPFRGVTRRIILITVVLFFVRLVLDRTPLGPTIMGWFALWPDTVLRHPWSLVTYAFMPAGLLSTLFSLLSVWFFGSTLEDQRDSRWLAEYFLVTTSGGGLLASLLALTRIAGFDPAIGTVGMWPFTIALIVAYAFFQPEAPLRFNFLFTLKAKYLAAIYLLVYVALTLSGGDRLGAAAAVFASLCGWLFLRFIPRRGLTFAFSERLYGLRNAFYRRKRKQAAKKFTVYMKKQGKDVNLDASGKYIGLDDERDARRDPTDKRWMN